MSWPTPPEGSWGSSPPPMDGGWSWPASGWHQQRRRGASWVTAVILFLAGGTAIGLGLLGHARLLPGPFFSGSAPSPAPSAGQTARSVPLSLSIPAIGLRVSLSQLGLNPNHTVEVPTDFQEPGWYEFGPSPGQIGSAVILGHVDSYRGPAVFFELRTLRPGDHVDVALADGVVAHFVVRQVAMYPKTSFPTVQVYGSHGYSALQLVTCGGVFDTQTRSYLSNIVVYTSLVSIS